MTNTQEKVKDLIEVRTFESLKNFYAEPGETISAYRFTDITAGMMANWLAAVTETGPSTGVAKALAGYRGVGKSHFLAAFSAIIANPELRLQVTDPHVSAYSQHLLRRRYPVANVRRGSKETLFEELRAGIADAIDVNESELPGSSAELLGFASEKAGDMPFVILIDTAHDRKERVARDDGEYLGELARIAKEKNIFVAVALDDDITEADGMNLAITQSYSIEYLDQEHLYRIVDGHIFPKNGRAVETIHQVYEYFRDKLPGFSWSEQRFMALYPLHPLILEIAPIIRLYAGDFALLNFASEAGSRILGRPVRSLIGLDEVFDRVEPTLRKDPNLNDAFSVYDKIGKEISSLVPVMERLQAKLILKALFILSLEGEGVTADEASAAMLIFDEQAAGETSAKVRELLETLVSVFPDDFWRTEVHGSEIRYSLKVTGKDNLNQALTDAVRDIPADALSKVLNRIASERYADWSLSLEGEVPGADWSDCQAVWRGSVRPVRMFWNWRNEEIGSLSEMTSECFVDLDLFISDPDQVLPVDTDGGNPKVFWNPAPLTAEEKDAILKYHVLVSDRGIRNDYSEQIGAAGHTYTVAVEKIWNRIFLEEAKFIAEGKEISLPKDASNAGSLEELLSLLLKPVFESAYPDHPIFTEQLGMHQVTSIVTDLFSGARVGDDLAQHLATTFAFPLGLVTNRGDNFVLASEEALCGLELVEKVLTLSESKENAEVSLETVYRKLKERPHGLTRESQHLILSALVALGKIDFVTNKGDRINRRSLDLRIIWNDISGIARPELVEYGSNRLAEWAARLAAVGEIESIDASQDRKKLKNGLLKWLEDWNENAILERFDALPSDGLNTKIWYTVVNVEKTFGKVADILQSLSDESIALDEALQRIADAFFDSKEEFEARQEELMRIEQFVEGAVLREAVWSYLSLCEFTENESIEKKRSRIEVLLDETISSSSAETNQELQTLWEEFHSEFAGYYAAMHDRVMRSDELKGQMEEILRSDEWWEFKNLSKLSLFRQDYKLSAFSDLSRFKELDCGTNLSELLNARPFCECSFRLVDADDWLELPKTLISTVMLGRDSYRRTLSIAADALEPALKELASDKSDEKVALTAEGLMEKLTNEKENSNLTTEEIFLLDKLLSTMQGSPVVKTEFPEISEFLSSDELSKRLNGWLSELPADPLYLEV